MAGPKPSSAPNSPGSLGIWQLPASAPQKPKESTWAEIWLVQEMSHTRETGRLYHAKRMINQIHEGLPEKGIQPQNCV
jgi:hypothetical protein